MERRAKGIVIRCVGCHRCPTSCATGSAGCIMWSYRWLELLHKSIHCCTFAENWFSSFLVYWSRKWCSSSWSRVIDAIGGRIEFRCHIWNRMQKKIWFKFSFLLVWLNRIKSIRLPFDDDSSFADGFVSASRSWFVASSRNECKRNFDLNLVFCWFG